jgi:hypothetical protein
VEAFIAGMAQLGEPFTFGLDDTCEFFGSCGLALQRCVPSSVYLSGPNHPIFDLYRFCLLARPPEHTRSRHAASDRRPRSHPDSPSCAGMSKHSDGSSTAFLSPRGLRPPECDPYVAAWWLPGPHLQPVWGQLFRRQPRVRLRSERWDTPDDDLVELRRLDAPRGPAAAGPAGCSTRETTRSSRSRVLDEARVTATANPALHVEFVPRGGHAGFVAGRAPWRPLHYAERRWWIS